MILWKGRDLTDPVCSAGSLLRIGVYNKKISMEPKIKRIIKAYYKDQPVEVRDVKLLDESPELGIACVRWKTDTETVTVKSIFQQGRVIINSLK
jgi:hypothetical protein